MAYEVGEFVIITKCRYGHRFKIGELVKIISVHDYEGAIIEAYDGEAIDGSSSWSFTSEECKAYKKVNSAFSCALSNEY